MRFIPSGRDRADDGEPACPSQRSAALSADITFPATVVNFSKHAGTGVTVRREDRGYVLYNENTAFTYSPQQPPVASFLRSRRGDADSNAPSEAIVLVMCAPAPARD